MADDWAPFILQDGEGEGAKPNAYRATFVGLANDRLDEDGDPARPGNHNYLEVFGIPPSLSVLAARAEADVSAAREACVDAVDRPGLEQWTDNVIYLDRDRARREYDQALPRRRLARQDDRVAGRGRRPGRRRRGRRAAREGAGRAARRSQDPRPRRPL